MGRKSNLEIKVGVFVFLGLLILTVLVVRAGDFYMKPGFFVRFMFDSVSGIETGSPVKLAGVKIGDITGIQVVRSTEGVTQVEATARITQGAFIEEDADVRINSLGLLGEKYIEVLPGTPGNKTLSQGSIIKGKAPIGLDQMSEAGSRAMSKLESVVDNLNEVVKEPKFKESLKSTFADASVAAQNVKEMSEDMKDAAKSARIVLARLRDGEGTVGRLLKDESIARDLEAFVADIKSHPWRLLKRD